MGAEDHAAKTAAALARQVAGLEAAANAAAVAASEAAGYVGRAQAAGFTKVAELIANLGGRIDKLAAMLSTAAGQITPGQQAVAEVTAQTTPAHAIDKLNATIDAVDTAHAAIAEAVQDTGDIETEAARVLEGSDPGVLLGMLQDVRKAASDAADHGTQARQHAKTGIAAGQQITGGGTGN